MTASTKDQDILTEMLPSNEEIESIMNFILHLLIGHPTITAATAFAVWQPDHYQLILQVGILIDVAMLAVGYRTKVTGFYKVWADAWKIKRRWPKLWVTVDKHRPLKTNETFRPRTVCPKLSAPRKLKVNHGQAQIGFKVKPATGRTLENLEEELTTLAAQQKQVNKISLDYQTATDSKGTLTFLLGEYLTEQTPQWEKV